MGKLEKRIISTLENANEGLSLNEIAERLEESPKKVFKALRKMFQKDKINSQNQRYSLSKK
jgi:DNA-binding CsgD family transcriptional regulator